MRRLAIVLTLLLGGPAEAVPCASLEARVGPLLDSATVIRMRYFNPEATDAFYDTRDVNTQADYDITVRCYTTCGADMHLLNILHSQKVLDAPCIGPVAARLDLLNAAGKPTSSLYFHFDGTCVTLEGKAYEIEESFIKKLHRTRVSEW